MTFDAQMNWLKLCHWFTGSLFALKNLLRLLVLQNLHNNKFTHVMR